MNFKHYEEVNQLRTPDIKTFSLVFVKTLLDDLGNLSFSLGDMRLILELHSLNDLFGRSIDDKLMLRRV